MVDSTLKSVCETFNAQDCLTINKTMHFKSREVSIKNISKILTRQKRIYDYKAN